MGFAVNVKKVKKKSENFDIDCHLDLMSRAIKMGVSSLFCF